LHAAGGAGRIGRVVADRTPGVAEIAAEIGTGPAIGIERLVHGVGRASVVEVGGMGRHRPSRSDQRERAFGFSAHATLHATAVNRGPALECGPQWLRNSAFLREDLSRVLS